MYVTTYLLRRKGRFPEEEWKRIFRGSGTTSSGCEADYTNSHRRVDKLNVAFLNQYFTGFEAQSFDLFFWYGLASGKLLDLSERIWGKQRNNFLIRLGVKLVLEWWDVYLSSSLGMNDMGRVKVILSMACTCTRRSFDLPNTEVTGRKRHHAINSRQKKKKKQIL